MNVNVAPRRTPTPTPSASRVYHGLALFYEYLFGPVYTSRIHSTIRSLPLAEGARVLEIGVGTGISLSAYPTSVQVTGIDLSQHMLDQAAEKIEARGWNHVELCRMDAQDLQFPDAEFDCVVAFHVASVVPQIERMMNEMVRVCKPGGTLVVINHFRSQKKWLAAVMDRLTPVTRVLGWRTNLPLDEIVNTKQMQVTRRFKTSPASLFTVVIGKKMA